MFSERGENWKRCLQALFVFPETRDVSKTGEYRRKSGAFIYLKENNRSINGVPENSFLMS